MAHNEQDTPLMELIDCYAISAMIGNHERAHMLRSQIRRRLVALQSIDPPSLNPNMIQIVDIKRSIQ